MEERIHKYPRTRHIRGSRLQDGDEDLEACPFEELKGHYLVVEEKLDGANSGLSFDSDANLLIQSRGHFLTGGYRERHFNLLKTWANRHVDMLFSILEDRYVMYGEWLFCKHTVFYDKLNHYFFEFDIMEKASGRFLSTDERRKLIGSAPIVSVPVVWEGVAKSLDHLISLIKPSVYKSATWKERLRQVAVERELDPEMVMTQTNQSDLSEGLYIKDEKDGSVIGRYKYVRSDFTQAILDSKTHWIDRPIIPNQLAPSVDIFSDNKDS